MTSAFWHEDSIWTNEWWGKEFVIAHSKCLLQPLVSFSAMRFYVGTSTDVDDLLQMFRRPHPHDFCSYPIALDTRHLGKPLWSPEIRDELNGCKSVACEWWYWLIAMNVLYQTMSYMGSNQQPTCFGRHWTLSTRSGSQYLSGGKLQHRHCYMYFIDL